MNHDVKTLVLKYLKTYLWVLPVMTFTALGAYVLLPFVLFGILGMPDLRELKKWSEQPLTWATNIGPSGLMTNQIDELTDVYHTTNRLSEAEQQGGHWEANRLNSIKEGKKK